MPVINDKNTTSLSDSFFNFLDVNWFNILTWVVGTAIAFLLYYLQNRRANSAYLEQVKQAKKEIIDTLENYIINELPINNDMIKNLRSGTERNYKVIIENEWSEISILQDINFRLQTSRHLAVNQKAAYSKSLDELIRQFKIDQNEIEFISLDNDKNPLIKQLIDNTTDVKKSDAKKLIIDILRIQEDQIKFKLHSERFTAQFDKIIISIAIPFSLIAIFSAFSTQSEKLENAAKNTVKSLTSISNIDTFLIFILFIIGILTLYYTYLDMKIKRKIRNDK